MASPTALLLAAGQGKRFGGPKALARFADGSAWLTRVASVLSESGLPVIAVLPAGVTGADELLPTGARSVFAPPASEGLSTSLIAGLNAVDPASEAVLIVTVDAPALPHSAIERVLEPEVTATTLRRAVYAGRPGHPVIIGRSHWEPLREVLAGDTGAAAYLRSAGADEIECGDLWHGHDIDTAPNESR